MVPQNVLRISFSLILTAQPKSVILYTPNESNIFSGLMSLWIIRYSCKYWSPVATYFTIVAAYLSGNLV